MMKHILKFDKDGNPIGVTTFEPEFEATLLEDEMLIEGSLPADFGEICTSWRKVEGGLRHVGTGGRWSRWNQDGQSWDFDANLARESVIADLKMRRKVEESSGFLHRGFLFDSDQASLARIQMECALAQNAMAKKQAYSNKWILADNSEYEINSAEEMIEIQVSASEHSKACHERYIQKKAAAVLAKTAEEFVSILEK